MTLTAVHDSLSEHHVKQEVAAVLEELVEKCCKVVNDDKFTQNKPNSSESDADKTPQLMNEILDCVNDEKECVEHIDENSVNWTFQSDGLGTKQDQCNGLVQVKHSSQNKENEKDIHEIMEYLLDRCCENAQDTFVLEGTHSEDQHVQDCTTSVKVWQKDEAPKCGSVAENSCQDTRTPTVSGDSISEEEERKRNVSDMCNMKSKSLHDKDERNISEIHDEKVNQTDSSVDISDAVVLKNDDDDVDSEVSISLFDEESLEREKESHVWNKCELVNIDMKEDSDVRLDEFDARAKEGFFNVNKERTEIDIATGNVLPLSCLCQEVISRMSVFVNKAMQGQSLESSALNSTEDQGMAYSCGVDQSVVEIINEQNHHESKFDVCQSKHIDREAITCNTIPHQTTEIERPVTGNCNIDQAKNPGKLQEHDFDHFESDLTDNQGNICDNKMTFIKHLGLSPLLTSGETEADTSLFGPDTDRYLLSPSEPVESNVNSSEPREIVLRQGEEFEKIEIEKELHLEVDQVISCKRMKLEDEVLEKIEIEKELHLEVDQVISCERMKMEDEVILDDFHANHKGSQECSFSEVGHENLLDESEATAGNQNLKDTTQENVRYGEDTEQIEVTVPPSLEQYMNRDKVEDADIADGTSYLSKASTHDRIPDESLVPYKLISTEFDAMDEVPTSTDDKLEQCAAEERQNLKDASQEDVRYGEETEQPEVDVSQYLLQRKEQCMKCNKVEETDIVDDGSEGNGSSYLIKASTHDHIPDEFLPVVPCKLISTEFDAMDEVPTSTDDKLEQCAAEERQNLKDASQEDVKCGEDTEQPEVDVSQNLLQRKEQYMKCNKVEDADTADDGSEENGTSYLSKASTHDCIPDESIVPYKLIGTECDAMDEVQTSSDDKLERCATEERQNVTRFEEQLVPSTEDMKQTEVYETESFYEEECTGPTKHREEKALEHEQKDSIHGVYDPGTKCFKWKYAPSYDMEDVVPNEEREEDVSPHTILPISSCKKPIRVGLSRRQQRLVSLHPYIKKH